MFGLGKSNIKKLKSNNDTGKLCKLLKHKQKSIRLQAIRALVEIDDPSTITSIMHLLDDPDPEVAEAADEAVEYLGRENDASTIGTSKTAVHPKTIEEKRDINKPVVKKSLEPKSSSGFRIEQVAHISEGVDSRTTDVVITDAILKLIRTKKDLPPLPDVVAKINEKLKSPESGIKEVSKLIAADPALTAYIIRVANSAYYSAGRVTIKDLAMAIGRLGLREIKNIVISFSLISAFEDSILINKKQFWKHSLCVAFSTHALSRVLRLPPEEQELAYISGLMHDIGIMVFGYIAPQSYANFLKKVVGDHTNDPDFELQRAEEQSFYANHSSVGAAYVDFWWPVDKQVVRSVQNHHRSALQKDLGQLDKMVIIANHFCNSGEIHNGVNVKLQKGTFDKTILQGLNLTKEQYAKFEELAKKGLEAADLILSM